jgi:ribosomal protein S18 acetylase RimI-like enzyme
MVQAMQNLKTQGMTGALLYVDDQNPTRAIKLYEKVGFKVYHKNTVYELQIA